MNFHSALLKIIFPDSSALMGKFSAAQYGRIERKVVALVSIIKGIGAVRKRGSSMGVGDL